MIWMEETDETAVVICLLLTKNTEKNPLSNIQTLNFSSIINRQDYVLVFLPTSTSFTLCVCVVCDTKLLVWSYHSKSKKINIKISYSRCCIIKMDNNFSREWSIDLYYIMQGLIAWHTIAMKLCLSESIIHNNKGSISQHEDRLPSITIASWDIFSIIQNERRKQKGAKGNFNKTINDL